MVAFTGRKMKEAYFFCYTLVSNGSADLGRLLCIRLELNCLF